MSESKEVLKKKKKKSDWVYTSKEHRSKLIELSMAKVGTI